MTIRKAFLLLAIASAWGGESPGFSQDPAAVKPPYDIRDHRRDFYDKLDKARMEGRDHTRSQGLKLSHDSEGNVIKDEAHRVAREHYDAKKRQLVEHGRADRRRDAEVNNLRQNAKIPEDAFIEYGAKPGDTAYGGVFSDRDITVRSAKELANLTKAARDRGYTVRPKEGYVYVEELDILFWNPQQVAVSRSSDGSLIVKKPGATERVDRLHDPEIVADPEHPSVSQQVKKAEKDLRGEAPTSTQEEFERTARLAKARAKAVGAVDPDGTQNLVSEQQRARDKALKSRKLDADDVADPYDKPEARQKKFLQDPDETAQTLRKCLVAERVQRAEKLSRLQQDRRDLKEKLRGTADALEADRLQKNIEANERTQRNLRRTQEADDFTLSIAEKKNPRIREKVTRSEVGGEPETPGKRQPGRWVGPAAVGVAIAGVGLSGYYAWEAEREASEKQHRAFSQARVAATIGR